MEDERRQLALHWIGKVQLDLLRLAHQPVDELVMDAFVHIDPFDGEADLASRGRRAPHHGSRRLVEVGAGGDHHWILAAKLQLDGDKAAGAGLGHLAPAALSPSSWSLAARIQW